MTLIEDLLDLQIPQVVKLSPDGQKVIYSTSLVHGSKKGEHSVATIWLAETGKPKSARQLTSGLYNDHDPKWSPDGETVSFLSDRAKQGESCAIYLISTKGGEAYPVTKAGNERNIDRYEFSPDGKFIAFLSADEKSDERKAKDKDKDDAQVWGQDWEYARLRTVHTSTKKVTTLVQKDAHIMDLAWSDDGSMIAYAEHQNPDIETGFAYGTTISALDLASSNSRNILHFPSQAYTLTWNADTLCFIGCSSPHHAATSSTMVYNIDLGTDKPSFQRCAHGETDCARALFKAGSDVLVYVQSGMEDQLRILNGRTVFARKKLIVAFDAAYTKDSDELVLAVAQGDVNTPTEVLTTLSSGGAMVKLSNHGHAFADRNIGTCTFLNCQSLDKEDELEGMYLTPYEEAQDGRPRKPLPTAVIIHGGPYYRNADAFNTQYFMWTPFLLASGYGVLIANYRGGSGRGEKFAAYARGGLGNYDYPDVISLTQHAIEKGFADKAKLIVGGWSQGGFLSFLCSVRNGMHDLGWKFKAAIPGAGVSDWDTMALSSDVGVLEAEMAGNGPWNMDKSDISNRQASSLYEMKKAAEAGVIPPMLILHGEKDVRVPLEQARGIRRGLDFHKLPYEYVVYPREGHTIKERKHLEDMLERLLRFCDLHLS